jgi:hypothetical protein
MSTQMTLWTADRRRGRAGHSARMHSMETQSVHRTVGEGRGGETEGDPFPQWTRTAPILVAVNPIEPSAVAPSLDGRRFVMLSSTNSAVDANSPSSFQYFERDGVIWGEYDGDTVTFGRFVGTRVGNELSVSFAHVMAADGLVVTGTSGSRVEDTSEGIRLVENFTIDDVDHVSICVEVLGE